MKKETEYKQRKKEELESILAQIEKKKDIQKLYNSNLDVLKRYKTRSRK